MRLSPVKNNSDLKSSPEELESRGYVDPTVLKKTKIPPHEILLEQLNSRIPAERTTAAMNISRIFSADINGSTTEKNAFIRALISALPSETKLYSKIAQSEALSAARESAIPFLIPILGSIGNNQHKKLPSKPFNKKSYPLPRDLVARILIRLSIPVLFHLNEHYSELTDAQIREAIDVIGHISFYSESLDMTSLSLLEKWYREKSDDDIIIWKIIRAFSAFNTPQVREILAREIKEKRNSAFVWEAQRSLNLLSKESEISD